MFSSIYMYEMFTYVLYFFCYGFPLTGMGDNNRFREWSRGDIDTAGSGPAV
jgi:hypothetical protein